MNGFKRILFLSAAVISGCFFVLSCENSQKDIDDMTRNFEMVEEAKHVVSYLSQGGHTKAKLSAPLMYRYTRDTVYVEFPDSLHVDFYNDSMRVETQVSALYGKYFEYLNKVYLKDSVVIFNIMGDTMRCPEMWWDQAKQKFYSDQPTRLDTKTGTHLVGDSFEASQDLNSRILKNPRGIVPSENIGSNQ
jgi:LPS export ABC transporter protein LptC